MCLILIHKPSITFTTEIKIMLITETILQLQLQLTLKSFHNWNQNWN